MNHEILYDQSFALAVVTLKQGERIMAESGAMVSMSPTIQLDAKMSGGGMMGAVKSAMGGESLYRTTFSAETGPGEVTLGSGGAWRHHGGRTDGPKVFRTAGKLPGGRREPLDRPPGQARGHVLRRGLFLLTVAGRGLLLLSSFGAIHTKELNSAKSTSLTPGTSWHLKTPCSGGSRRRPVRRRASAVS